MVAMPTVIANLLPKHGFPLTRTKSKGTFMGWPSCRMERLSLADLMSATTLAKKEGHLHTGYGSIYPSAHCPLSTAWVHIRSDQWTLRQNGNSLLSRSWLTSADGSSRGRRLNMH